MVYLSNKNPNKNYVQKDYNAQRAHFVHRPKRVIFCYSLGYNFSTDNTFNYYQHASITICINTNNAEK